MSDGKRNGYSYTYQAIEDLRAFSAQEDALSVRLQPLARGGIVPRPGNIEDAYRLARAEYGRCAAPLGSTQDALSPGNNATKVKPEE